ncbi:unnamed protein product [Blepharisma stoltei]|uniref:Uncharacterized protein n=1 Tax=Blepharisma stoltei TaxID=1481888 RepID=A0AAU9KQK8_9CILI|nr:unnamed protein product [Blepharisma stoltei]
MGSCTSVSYSRVNKKKSTPPTESNLNVDPNSIRDNYNKNKVIMIDEFIHQLMKEQLLRKKAKEAPSLSISKSDLYSRRLSQVQLINL